MNEEYTRSEYESDGEEDYEDTRHTFLSQLMIEEDDGWQQSEKLVLKEVRKELKRSKVTEIDGNLYTYWAFLDVMRIGTDEKVCSARNLNVQAGLFFVMLVQLIGPPSVLIYTMYAIDWSDISVGVHDWRYIHGTMDHGISNLGKRILAFLIIFVFLLNGSDTILTDRNTSRKIARFVVALAEDEVPIRKHWLWIGAIVNCWVVVVSSLAMVPLFILAKSPKVIIFDSFALLFLFRLDDVAGDLGLMTEKWETDVIGSWYDRIVHYRRWKQKHLKRRSETDQLRSRNDSLEWRKDIETRLERLENTQDDSDSDESDDTQIYTHEGLQPKEFLRPDQWTEDTVYKFTLGILATLGLIMPFVYAFVQGAKPKHFNDRAIDLDSVLLEFQTMQEQVISLQAQLNALTGTTPAPIPR